ncbi:MAG: hypothetical protein JWL75_478 [Parcubacteria group bacterium]|nr:hypothetical protein [Parcubacteria group bacterium]
MEKMDNFSEQVVAEIEARGVSPLPRWHFLFRRSVFWTCAILSVLSGAIAYSVADYVFFDNEGMGPTAILESPIEGILHTIPFVWLIVFGLFAASAYLNLRKTRTGYRYRAALAILAVIIITIGLGAVLNMFDFGQTIHYYLLHHTTFYDALIHSSDDIRVPI